MTFVVKENTRKSKFITTESLNLQGETGEKIVWQAIKNAFKDKECLAYWRYPIFSFINKNRKEPDILIADLELGLIIIEVKSITIEQIVNINGHHWQYQNFYTTFGNPYQQAEQQLFNLLEYTNCEPTLKQKITSKVIIALPYISQQEWQARNFDRLPSKPPIIFQNHLPQPELVYQLIQETSPVITGKPITPTQWQLLLSIIAGNSVFCTPSHRLLSNSQSRGSILQKLRNHISKFDLEQEKIGKQIPPGAQRIRGIAGSGKTVLLCQKAAHIHLKHPDWKIALVFFSRSLYQPIITQLDKWLNYFSKNQLRYDPKNRNLLVLHAWGSQQQPGLYSFLSQASGIKPLSLSDLEKMPDFTAKYQPNEALAAACIQLLKAAAIPQLFDAILIDEGQDLIVDRYKFEDKQPFYWLAYQALRTVDPIHPEQKRLIWAYDELQSLTSAKIPNARELFGEELAHLVTGKYSDGIKKTEIIYRCYRTPHEIITVAHALGMGLLRPQGMLSGPTHPEEWQAIGYEVKGDFTLGKQVTIQRPRKNSLHPLREFWQGEIINWQIYHSRQEELSALATKIKHNLRYDGLRPSREILVIILGKFYDALKLKNYVANFLFQQRIDFFLPGNFQCNLLKNNQKQRKNNKFWCEGAVTVASIHQVKGHQADLVYLVGLDRIAQDESNIYLRNQLFTALTRAKAWVYLSGIGDYLMYQEMHKILKCQNKFTFFFRHPPQREIIATDIAELLKKYALGRRNFQNAELENANLMGVCLKNVNLIGANLRRANLQNADLQGAKLVAADLSFADLSGANLKRAKLVSSILTKTNFNNANLTNINFSGANLADALYLR